MAWECSIRLIDSRGRPIRGYKVSVNFSFWVGSDSGHTDNDGWVTFSYDNIEKEELQVDAIWVRLSLFPLRTKALVEDVRVENGETMSFTLTDDDWR